MRVVTAVSGLALQLIGTAAVVFAIARAAYHPFWAARAAGEDLATSWGGPTPLGATLVHWLVAALLAAAGWLLLRLGSRWRMAG